MKLLQFRSLLAGAITLGLACTLISSPALANERDYPQSDSSEALILDRPAVEDDKATEIVPADETALGDKTIIVDTLDPVDENTWFTAETEESASTLTETEPEGSTRVRTFQLDATSVLASLISPDELFTVMPGERLVVNPLSRSFSFLGFEDQVIIINVAEVALVLANDGSILPTVEVLGNVIDQTDAVAFVFSPGRHGDYSLDAHVDNADGTAMEVSQISEMSYRIDDVNLLSSMSPDADSAGTGSPELDDSITIEDEPSDPIYESYEPGTAAASTPLKTVSVLFGVTTGTGTLAQMKTELATHVARTNSAFITSKMTTRIVQQDTISVAYTQHPTNMNTDITLAVQGAGNFKALRKHRDTIGADMIAVIVPVSTDYCGLGYTAPLQGQPEYAVSVSAKNCLDTYTLAHEIGHNLGSKHDFKNSEGKGATNYSYGYAIPGVARDIMAYDCAVTCPRKQQFANPAVDFLNNPGVKSGTNTANSSRIIDLVAAKATNYRATVVAWDVPTTHQFYKEINWLLNKQITTGHSDGTFRPKAQLSREAMAAFLYRFAGKPTFSPPSTSPFTDVPKTYKFYKEITWLSAKGITGGRADGSFGPSENVTREAMAAFLYRFAGKPAYSAPAVSPFNDVPKTHQFYKEIAWLKSSGLATGRADGTFGPKDAVTREAAAAFLYRYDDKF